MENAMEKAKKNYDVETCYHAMIAAKKLIDEYMKQEGLSSQTILFVVDQTQIFQNDIDHLTRLYNKRVS